MTTDSEQSASQADAILEAEPEPGPRPSSHGSENSGTDNKASAGEEEINGGGEHDGAVEDDKTVNGDSESANGVKEGTNNQVPQVVVDEPKEVPETPGEVPETPTKPSQTPVTAPGTPAAPRDSIATSRTSTDNAVFTKPLQAILNSKECKKNEALRNAVEGALATPDTGTVFDALKITCETGTPALQSMAIDLFAKLFDYGHVEDDEKLAQDSVDVIAACFDGEGTDQEVELQVVRALMHSILIMPCHGASLLKAVRLIYNVFIFSLSARNQAVAQGTLTQVITAVFLRVSTKDGENGTPEPGLALAIAGEDAFLIFRAMCKLSVKDLDAELDMRSHGVRSKLVSLNIIHTILKQYIDLFVSPVVVLNGETGPVRMVDAVRQYLSLALSRNAALSLAPVFELSLEIFWLIMSNLRAEFKREIPLFLDEIYFPVAEMKTSTAHQKRYFLAVVERWCNDSRGIIEFYLNYDCDSEYPNICERMIDYLTRVSMVRVEVTPQQRAAYAANPRGMVSVYDISKIANLISSQMQSRPPEPDYHLYPVEWAMKVTAIGCTVGFLRSLHTWGARSANDSSVATRVSSTIGLVSDNSLAASPNASTASIDVTPTPTDEFDTLKQRKKALLEGIKQFNNKPKRGIQYFIENGFIEKSESKDDDTLSVNGASPTAIAQFLLTTDGLDKAVIGEYLGEGNNENIAVMHSFVDLMDFTGRSFVDAMRTFLQSFRLPGEAQKIDRFMLKFAERFVMGNPRELASADAAYVLLYSVIMLNTDLHSPQIKKRMTLDSFVQNNAGIDDNKDLPREYLESIYQEIATNEIKLQSEQHAALLAGELPYEGNGGLFGSRDLNKEAYIHASKEMSTKTEKLVRDLGKRVRASSNGGVGNGDYHIASHVYHVRSIFDTVWMSILAGLTPPFQEYDEPDVSLVCLDGIKLAIKIACMFSLEMALESFVLALIQFENLTKYHEMKPKNVQAIHIVLELASSDGDYLQSSWGPILTSISHLEKVQMIVMDSSGGKHNELSPQVAEMLNSSDLTAAVDKVFVHSARLSGDSIVAFITALATVAWEEIGLLSSTTPRLFSLQKFVDICYYNMTRIKVQWTQIWAAMGPTFHQAGCHANVAVAAFAVDSLRQLLMRFLELDELAHFKFQKEFLAPFATIASGQLSIEIKDMVVECMSVMVKTKLDRIRSGWRAIFSVLGVTASENTESLVVKSFKLAESICREHEAEVKAQDAYKEMIACFTAVCNGQYQRVSLLALDALAHQAKTQASNNPGGGEANSSTYVVLNSFYHVVMECPDLEVRTAALAKLFDILLEYGDNFDADFWEIVCNDLLFPIFSVLHDADGTDDLWLSTTLIQALRNMVGLLTHYYDSLSPKLGKYLELMENCICLENDTIARMGRSCLFTVIVENGTKFGDDQWKLIVQVFQNLFKNTEAKELFELDPENNQQPETVSGMSPSRSIVIKCVLQLLLIESLSELFDNDLFYESVPYNFLHELSMLLHDSFQFSKKFNDNYDLRLRLWNAGVIERMPNLLKQESSSLAVFINIMFRMYCDDDKTSSEQKQEIIKMIMPLCKDIIHRFSMFDETNQQRNISTWKPVIIEIYQGIHELEDDDFKANVKVLYTSTLDLFARNLSTELRASLKSFFAKAGELL